MEDPVVDEGVRSSERPVDYSKAKFSIEFLLEKAPSHYPPQSILFGKNSEARTAGSCNASGYTTTALEDFQHSRSGKLSQKLKYQVVHSFCDFDLIDSRPITYSRDGLVIGSCTIPSKRHSGHEKYKCVPYVYAYSGFMCQSTETSEQ